jgi:predicted membrane protein
MKKLTTVLWGLALIGAGAIFALNALGITRIDVFFDGWWTLFIIIPCISGLFTQKDKSGNLFGIAFGVFLLLCAQDILQFSLIWKLFLPAVVIYAGLKLVFSGIFGKKKKAIEVNIDIEGSGSSAFFSGSEVNYSGEVFAGTNLTAIFGGVDCDLRNAIIENNCTINVTAIFGGIDIKIPDNVNVISNVAGIFGGVDCNTPKRPGAPTVRINGACIFGGVDIV